MSNPYFLYKPLTPLRVLKYNPFMIVHVFMLLKFLINVPGLSFIFLSIQHISLQLSCPSCNATPVSFKNYLCDFKYIGKDLEYSASICISICPFIYVSNLSNDPEEQFSWLLNPCALPFMTSGSICSI